MISKISEFWRKQLSCQRAAVTSTIHPFTRSSVHPHTCEGFDAWALEQASWAVLVVPVIGVPAVVDAIVVLLLDLHVFILRRYWRHLDLATTPPPPPPLPPSPSTCCLLLLATGPSNTHPHTLTGSDGQAEKLVYNLQRWKQREGGVNVNEGPTWRQIHTNTAESSDRETNSSFHRRRIHCRTQRSCSFTVSAQNTDSQRFCLIVYKFSTLWLKAD